MASWRANDFASSAPVMAGATSIAKVGSTPAVRTVAEMTRPKAAKKRKSSPSVARVGPPASPESATSLRWAAKSAAAAGATTSAARPTWPQVVQRMAPVRMSVTCSAPCEEWSTTMKVSALATAKTTPMIASCGMRSSSRRVSEKSAAATSANPTAKSCAPGDSGASPKLTPTSTPSAATWPSARSTKMTWRRTMWTPR